MNPRKGNLKQTGKQRGSADQTLGSWNPSPLGLVGWSEGHGALTVELAPETIGPMTTKPAHVTQFTKHADVFLWD